MKDSIKQKLESLCERHEELQHLLGSVEIIEDQNKFRELSKEYSQLEDITRCFTQYRQALSDKEEATLLMSDPDPELQAMGAEELEDVTKMIESLEQELQVLLLPKDPNDERSCFLEIRAGAGGDEAGIFSGDLFRMYSRYAEKRRWTIEMMSMNPSEKGGYKEVIVRVDGAGAYGTLKFESGGHRVQRVPETEAQGRVHTSACTVAVLVELPEAELPTINPSELRIDTFRSSGAGGQHVNTTDSAIRITHLPTGLVVECQDERSQHKNKAKAMSVLAARLIQAEEQRRADAEASTRRNLLGSGDRSDRIRTYNYAQSRVTDHRINLTLYRLSDILEGDLESLIEPIKQEYQADQLASLSERD